METEIKKIFFQEKEDGKTSFTAPVNGKEVIQTHKTPSINRNSRRSSVKGCYGNIIKVIVFKIAPIIISIISIAISCST